jgi:hypothetical protein
VRGITTVCRLTEHTTTCVAFGFVVFVNFSNRSIHMKVSLVALVAGCAVASSAFGGVDMPPIVPPHARVLDMPPIVPPHARVLDMPPIVPPHARVLDMPPIVPPHARVMDMPPIVPPHARVMDMPPIVPPHAA